MVAMVAMVEIVAKIRRKSKKASFDIFAPFCYITAVNV
jgi:hypothetical protein